MIKVGDFAKIKSEIKERLKSIIKDTDIFIVHCVIHPTSDNPIYQLNFNKDGYVNLQAEHLYGIENKNGQLLLFW